MWFWWPNRTQEGDATNRTAKPAVVRKGYGKETSRACLAEEEEKAGGGGKKKRGVRRSIYGESSWDAWVTGILLRWEQGKWYCTGGGVHRARIGTGEKKRFAHCTERGILRRGVVTKILYRTWSVKEGFTLGGYCEGWGKGNCKVCPDPMVKGW